MTKKVLIILTLFFLLVPLGGKVLSGEKSESWDILEKFGIRDVLKKLGLRDTIKNFVVHHLSRVLNGTLTIGEVEGNLYQHLILTNVQLTQEGKEVLSIPRLVLRYDIAGVWKQRVTVKQIVIESPHLSLQQLPDGSWNVAHLLKKAKKGKKASQPAESGEGGHATFLPDSFLLQELRIRDGEVEVTFLKPTADPRRTFRNLSVRASSQVFPDSQEFHIEELRFTSTTNPPFVLKHTTVSLAIKDKALSLSQFRIQTTHSQVEGTLTVNDLTPRTVQGTLIADLNLSEISAVLPGVPLQGKLKEILHISGPLDTLRIENNLEMGTGVIGLTGILNLTEATPRYDLTLQVQKVNLQEIIAKGNLPSNLNMEFAMQGKGISPTDARGAFRLVILPSQIKGTLLDRSLLKGTMQEGLFHFETLDLHTPFGTLTGGGKIDLYGETTLTYTLTSDLAPLRPLLHSTALSGQIQSQGEIVGLFPHLQAQGALQLDALTYNEVSLRKGKGVFTAQDLVGMLSAQADMALEGLVVGENRIEQTRLHAWYVKETGQVMFDLLTRHFPTRSLQLTGVGD